MTVSRSTNGGNNLILVRHTKVEVQFQDTCYGASDVRLSEDGEAHARALAPELAAMNPARIFHSGLGRSKFLAELIASHAQTPLAKDARLAEMNFGDWELKSWDQIYAEVGHDIGRLTSEPDTFAPPGGETVHAVRDRIVAWAEELPDDGPIVAVSHGGPISALRRTLSGQGHQDWTELIPTYGEVLSFELPLF